MKDLTHKQFATTTRGLDRSSPAMHLFEKAKKLGIWNPSEIDFSQDIQDWQGFSSDEKDLILRLIAIFLAGEEAVTLDLLPLISVIAQEGRVEEEIFLTSFLWEEAKHTDFFSRFLTEVLEHSGDLSHYHTKSYKSLFYEHLPNALQSLREDSSPAAQVKAAVTYNMVVEGMLAETGYHVFFIMLEENDLMPGLRGALRLLKQDEARHIAYGVFLISRLLAVDETLWEPLEAHMNMLMYPALAVITEGFAAYEIVPFGLAEGRFISYATRQFQTRLERIEKARGSSLEDVYRVTNKNIRKEA